MMFDWRSPAEWKRLFRFYQAGLVNAAVGPGLFVLFVYLGMNAFLAQLTSHLAGMAFNYFTYSRYAFAGMRGSKAAFVVTYTVIYAISVATLAVFTWIGLSPYIGGLLAIAVVSLINFFVLKRFVFTALKADL